MLVELMWSLLLSSFKSYIRKGHSPSAREDILLQMRPFHMEREFLSDKPTWLTGPFIFLFKYLDSCIVLHQHVNYDYTSILQGFLSFLGVYSKYINRPLQKLNRRTRLLFINMFACWNVLFNIILYKFTATDADWRPCYCLPPV